MRAQREHEGSGRASCCFIGVGETPGDTTTRSFFFFDNRFRARGELNSSRFALAICRRKKTARRWKPRPTTAEPVHNDNGLLWRIVTDHPDIFDTHVVSKLNRNDVKFFDVNSESRRAVKRLDNKLG